MSVKASAETLRSIPIFADCDSVHLQVVAFSAERQQFQAGENIIVQGKIGSAAFLVLSGKAELWRDDGAGAAAIGEAGPGAFLGEVAMIAERSYSLTATAIDPVATVKIDRNLFLRVAEEYPEFGAKVFQTLSKRLDDSLADLGGAKSLLDRAKSFSTL